MPGHFTRCLAAVACAVLLSLGLSPHPAMAQSAQLNEWHSLGATIPAEPTVVDRSAQWSPDGEWLLVRSWADDRPGLRLWNVKGRFWRKVPTGWGFMAAPTWSPDGHAVACLVDGRLTTIDVVGLVMSPVSGGPADRVNAYAWSPQSQQLAALVGGETGDRRLLIIDRENGAASHSAVIPKGYGEPARLDWSPRGTHLLLHSAGGSWIYDSVQELWQPVGGLSGPVREALWEPGGAGLAVTSRSEAGGTEVVLVDSGGRVRFRFGRSADHLTPLSVNWRSRRVLLGDGSGRAVLAASGPRRYEVLRGVRTLAVAPLAGGSAVTGGQTGKTSSYTPALWLVGVAAAASRPARRAVADFGLAEYRPRLLASPGWSAEGSSVEGQSKVMLLPAGAQELDNFLDFTVREGVLQVDPAPEGRSLALISTRSGRPTQRTVALRTALSGSSASGVRLGPSKGPDRPNWVWPLATVALVTGTFVFGLLLTFHRSRR